MISYKVIRQEKTELHLNSDYLRLVLPERNDVRISVQGFITGGEAPIFLTAINEGDYSIINDQITSPGNYLFSIAGIPIIQINVYSGEIARMSTRNSPPENYYDIKVSWEEK